MLVGSRSMNECNPIPPDIHYNSCFDLSEIVNIRACAQAELRDHESADARPREDQRPDDVLMMVIGHLRK